MPGEQNAPSRREGDRCPWSGGGWGHNKWLGVKKKKRKEGGRSPWASVRKKRTFCVQTTKGKIYAETGQSSAKGTKQKGGLDSKMKSNAVVARTKSEEGRKSTKRKRPKKKGQDKEQRMKSRINCSKQTWGR